MAINVEDYGVPDASAGRRRLQTDARQGRWLFELEHAMLQGAKKPAPAGDSSPAAPWQDAASALPPARKMAPAAERQDSSDSERGGQQAVAQMPVQMAPAPAMQAASSASPAAPQAAGAAAAERTAATARSAPGGQAGAPGAGLASATPALAALTALAASAPSQQGLAAAYGAAALPLAAAGNLAAGQADTAALPPAAAVGAALELSLAGAAPAAPPQAEASETAPEAPAPSSSQPEAHPDDEYAQRLLHLYRDGSAVQAWVRDAALTQLQTQNLAQTLARELGSTGAQLAALTVNGKRMALEAGAQPGAEMDSYQPETAPDAQHSAPQPVRKINANGAF